MSTKDSSEVEEGTMTISDVIRWQDNLKKDIDLDKPDDELTTVELAQKAIYHAIDDVLEEKIGVDVKKEIDETRQEKELLTQFQNKLNKLSEIGREVEKTFMWQNAYLINHFDKSDENHFKLMVNGMTTDVVNQEKQISNSERIEFANNILEIIKTYREKVVKELVIKQEIITALLPALEKKLHDTDFGVLSDEIIDKNSAEKMKSQFQEWLELSKKLLKSREKAIEAVKDQLDMDEMLPSYVIQNEGDVTKSISGVDMYSKGERMIRLINEADEVEKEVEQERTKISEGLFGKISDYMEIDKDNVATDTGEKIINPNHLETRTWYRFAKVLYIGSWIIGLVISAIAASESNFGTFIGGVIIIWIVLGLTKKAFLYTILGKDA